MKHIMTTNGITAAILGTALLLSACKSTRAGAGPDDDPEAPKAEPSAPAGDSGSFAANVSRDAYYHSASERHLAAMEEALKQLEVIPADGVPVEAGGGSD